MAFEAATILQFVLLVAWTCLNDTPVNQKHVLFGQFFPTQADFDDIVSLISLVFAPGLFQVLQAATPPTIAYFKTLPTTDYKRWAIYALVLEKAGCRPRLYIGSGTGSRDGVHSRLVQYDSFKVFPRYVAKSIDEGFTIVHKGLLCWIPIPGVHLQPVIRLLFLVLEATFAFMFWAMKAKLADYGMSHICLWDRANLEYDGLCSHPSLKEGIRGDFGLSAEEIEVLAAERKQINAEKQAIRSANWYYSKMANDRDEFLDHVLETSNAWREANYERYMDNHRNYIADVRKSKKYHCEVCNFTTGYKTLLTKHRETPRHLYKTQSLERDLATKPYTCRTCSYATKKKRELTRHLSSARHKSKMATSSSSELD
ncbi:hypothetical protein BKA64DRAFT_283440 [Cadophora sp. MPI-SDFR-AT-0126]|nr:hypothetical protein BKA64DRAFT_283440 [Leotiomycetes sp. MPI-SDFR-AT-0126]